MPRGGGRVGATRAARRDRAAVAALAAAILLVAGACTSTASNGATTATTIGNGAAGAEPGDGPGPQHLTPLLLTALTPDPIPVMGSDGRVHVAYELSVLNYSPNPAVITSLDTLGPDGKVVTSLSQEQVSARTMIVPELSVSGAPPAGIPAGSTALLVLEDVYPDRASVPGSVSHRLSATFASDGSSSSYAALWPSSVTETGGPVAVSGAGPVVIGAPLQGSGWEVGNGCCDLNHHRFVLFPTDGRINGGERFAIDFSRIDVAGATDHEVSAGLFLRPGTDGTKNGDYLGYGAPVLAVADATVVTATSGVPDAPPGGKVAAEGLSLDQLGGNEIVLRLAPDLYAFYFHLAPGSVTVEEGAHVTKGQTIARLGNSGNSSGAHLHFQLSRSPSYLSSDSVPYVFDGFTLRGTLTQHGLVEEPAPGVRHDELPLDENIVDFP